MKTGLHYLVSAGLLAAGLFALPSCKKDSGGSTNNSSYYLSASVSGKAWNGNVTFDTVQAPVFAVLSGVTPGSLAAVAAEETSGSEDTSAFVIVFPVDIPLNHPWAFSTSDTALAAYSVSAALTYETPTSGYSGNSITLTALDQANHVIEGTFTGTFSNSAGSASVTVTNGKFRAPYIIDATQQSSGLPGGIKF